MRSLCVGILLSLAVAQPAWAQNVEAEPLVNDPSSFWATTKKVVDVLQPQYEQVYDIKSGEWFNGFSAALYRLRSNNIYLGSIRAGYAVDQKAYAGAKADLPGLVTRYVPQGAKRFLAPDVLKGLWSVAGKYAALGVVAGYDWDNSDPIVGFTLGGQVRF